MADDDFQAFVETRYAELLRIAYLLTGSTHEAEDLLQSTLLRVMRKWRQVDDPIPYVRRVMINYHISGWRRHRAREVLIPFLPDRWQRDTADRITERHALFDALRELSPRTRAVIVLRIWADLPEATVADLLGCSNGTVKSRLSRGLRRVRDVLGPSAQAPTLPVTPARSASMVGEPR